MCLNSVVCIKLAKVPLKYSLPFFCSTDPTSASEVEEIVTEILEDVAEDMDTHDIVGELLEAHTPSLSPPGDGIVDESNDENDVESVSEGESVEEEILEEDRCNSAGEEVCLCVCVNILHFSILVY